MRLSGLLLLHIFTLTKLCAQVPKADFSTSKVSYCQGEAVILENKSEFADSYAWDFCTGDLENALLYKGNINKISSPYDISIHKENDIWYAFVVNRKSIVYRIVLGEKLNRINTANLTAEAILNENILFKELTAIEIIKEGNKWYGFLVSDGNHKLYRVDFGTSLLNTPQVHEILNETFLNQPFDIAVIQEKDTTIALVTNYLGGKLTEVKFGNSVTNIPVVKNHSVAGNMINIEATKISGKWYGLISKWSNKTLHQFTYSNSLNDNPAFSLLTTASFNENVIGLEFAQEADSTYAFVQALNGNLYRLDYNQTTVNQVNSLGNIGGKLSGYSISLTHISEESEQYLWVNNYTAGRIDWLQFEDICATDLSYSKEKEPKNVRYNEAGNHKVILRAYNEVGKKSEVMKEIGVSYNSAPVVDIVSDNVLCINSIVAFSGINRSHVENNVTAWSWNFGDGTTATSQEVTHQYSIPGTYTITLEVQSINGCSNRITKEITIYDPPAPGFTSPTGTICTNGEVSFTNQTDTQGADDLVSYHWDFNGEGSSTEANPTYVFSSGGAKAVTLTASIPGCSESFSQTINVEQGPVVGFEVPYVCEGREVQFANTTTGTGITAYNWDFGDGGTYTSATATDPFYTYQTSGTYTVTLTVGNALGCNNVFSRQVAVYTQPVADFLAEVACVGIPMQLTDQSTSGTTSNIIQWRWDFGDGKGVANVRNPVYTYQQPGTYQVRLEVTSSAGCIGEVVKEITVATPVTADFTYTLQCHAENNNAYTLQLQDASVASTGNRITQWLWTVNGESFTTPQVNYTFDGPGTYDITLTATAASACSDAITKTVEIFTPPAVAFTYEPACASEAVVFTNTTSDGSDADAINPIADSVTRYTWDFGGVGTSFEVNPQFAFNKAGTYPVRLTVHTKDGCAYRQVQQVEVPAQPQAKFRPSTTRGAYPLTVQFDNQSIQYSQHIWVINGDTLKGQSPDYTFTAAGQYEAWLTVANELGCSHTTSQQIIVVEPVWNVVLENVLVTVSEDGGSYQLILTVRNAGTLVVEGFPVNVRVDQLIALNEHFGGQIAPGERINYVVPFTLSANLNAQVSFLCVTLQDKPGASPDVSANDNRMCINLKDAYSSLAPYPNPVKGQMYLSLILNEAAAVDIQVEDSRGSQVKGQHYTETRKGLNIFNVDMSTLANGLYLIHMRFAGHAKTYRVVVQH